MIIIKEELAEEKQVFLKANKPEWLKIKPLPIGEKFSKIKNALKKRNLYTVCGESHCPNIPECWANEGTATFLLMGDVCTRACRFCNIKTGSPKPLDAEEPEKIASAIAEMELDYAVLTSVDRDDLPDQGANHFAECIREIKKQHPETIVEVLIPDFRGDELAIKTIVDADPEVIAHNLETVKELQRKARDYRANYEQSLKVLRTVKKFDPRIFTKSSLMLGLGEAEEQVLQAMKDLRANDVDIITFGQYLRPSGWHLKVEAYIKPEKFEWYKQKALELGFAYCASGPFVRSSYKAGELFVKNVLQKK